MPHLLKNGYILTVESCRGLKCGTNIVRSYIYHIHELVKFFLKKWPNYEKSTRRPFDLFWPSYSKGWVRCATWRLGWLMEINIELA